MQSPRRSLWDGNQGSTIRINYQTNALYILHELWTFVIMNLEHVDNKNAAFLTAFVEVVRIWPGQGVLKLRCWQYEDRGSQSWGVGEGGIKGAHDMRIVAPLYKVQRGDVFILDSVYNIREVFWGEREFTLIICRPPVCLCSHQGEHILSDSTSLLCPLLGRQVSPQLWEWKQFVVQKQQAQEIAGFESHTELQHK